MRLCKFMNVLKIKAAARTYNSFVVNLRDKSEKGLGVLKTGPRKFGHFFGLWTHTLVSRKKFSYKCETLSLQDISNIPIYFVLLQNTRNVKSGLSLFSLYRVLTFLIWFRKSLIKPFYLPYTVSECFLEVKVTLEDMYLFSHTVGHFIQILNFF